MAQSATLAEFTEHAAQYVRSAARGDECVITENGEPVAVIKSFQGEKPGSESTVEERAAVIQRMLACARASGPTNPPGLSAVDELSRLRDEREAAVAGFETLP